VAINYFIASKYFGFLRRPHDCNLNLQFERKRERERKHSKYFKVVKIDVQGNERNLPKKGLKTFRTTKVILSLS
jgi:hypothetical protein